MSADSKKSLGGTVVLILFGILAVIGGTQWLVLLVPAAILIWYGADSMLRSGRN